METVDVIQVAPNERVRIVHDELPSQPENHGAPLTLLVVGKGDVTVFNEQYDMGGGLDERGRLFPVLRDQIMNAFRHFDEYAYYRRQEPWNPVQRYFRIFHDVKIHVSHHTGYMQGDSWALVSVDTPEWRNATGVSDSLTVEQAEWTEPVDWVRGDVYGAIHEVWSATCDNREHDDWMEQDSVWGFYGDHMDADLRDAMLWSFGLEGEEVAA